MDDIEYPYERKRRIRRKRLQRLGTDGLRRTNNPLSLYKALQIGYLRDEQEQQAKLKKFGYVLDKELSDGKQHVVAYNPATKKALYIINGSSTNILNPNQLLKDWRTNVINIPTGTLKYTPRYMEEANIYQKIHDKYRDSPVILAGHSQSGATINRITERGDYGISLNPALINNTENPNVKNYRAEGDIVSAFANPETIKTIETTGALNPLQSHNIETIKQSPIFL